MPVKHLLATSLSPAEPPCYKHLMHKHLMHLTAPTHVDMDDRDNRIATLGCGLGALRLALGEGLLRLSTGDIQDFGFPTFESYVREALGRTGRWGADVRGLARRLRDLPHLRAALASGRLSLSVVELVARLATPDDEAEWVDLVVGRVTARVTAREWVDRVPARGMNVRQLRAELKDRKLEVGDDTTPPRVSIAMTVDRVDAWAFEQARIMVEAVGARRGDETIEAMLAEGLGALLASDPDIDLPATIGGALDVDGAEARAFRLEVAALRERAEAAVEAMRPKDDVVPPATLVVTWPEADDPTAPAEIDRQLRSLAVTLAMRDIELGELACYIVDREVWRTFGYASFDHYCRERIGLAPSSVATRVALTRRFGLVPEVRAALGEGRICYEAAALIARVAGPMNVQAWIERATQRTVGQLREDVDATELLARLEGCSPSKLDPPDDDTRNAVDDIERSVIAAVTGLTETPASQMSETMLGQTSGQMSETMLGQTSGQTSETMLGQTSGQMSETMLVQTSGQTSETMLEPMSGSAPEAGSTTLRLSLTEGTGHFWRALERLHNQMSGGAPFLPFLVCSVLDAWRDTTDGKIAYADVYLRDRWRCASPVCRSRNVTPHHLVFRSHGGGEERSNLISLCERCHLELVHHHKLLVSGCAPDGLTWHAKGWVSGGDHHPAKA